LGHNSPIFAPLPKKDKFQGHPRKGNNSHRKECPKLMDNPPLCEVFTLPHLFLLESSWNPTIPGRNTRNPGGMTRNFLPANLHSNPQFLVLPSPGGIHLESWQISSPTRIPGHLGGIIPPGILLESYHSW